MLQKFAVLFVLVLSLWILAACGGDTGSAPPPADFPTTEAAASPTTAEATAEEGTKASETAVKSADKARTFTIVPGESKASYIVGEEFFGGAVDRLGITAGVQDTIGSTQQIEGKLQLNLSDPSPLISGHLVVNIESLTSDQSRRDNRIRTHNLESSKYPLAEFTATSIQDAPAPAEYVEGEEVSFKLVGDMTIRGITNPAIFDVTATLANDTITGVGISRLKMSDFGFDPPNFANVFSVEDEFSVEVVFTFSEG